MITFSDIVKNLQDRLFKTLVSQNLVYNTCWEDPRLDRKMLQLDEDSNVVMLTSAGCNALDYLLDAPSQVHCVDVNPAQNSLLNLKKALFQHGNYSLLWDFFGEGQKAGADVLYQRNLRWLLPPADQRYWDDHISYFTASPTGSSFYYKGTSGKVAMMFRNRIQRKGLKHNVTQLLNAQSIKEQVYYFDEVEPLIWNGFHKWLIGNNATMSMLGVPAVQRNMIEQEYDGILDFIRQSLRRVFTELSIQNNYFWRVYLTGSYTRDCCPNYLRKNYFSLLQKRVANIQTHTASLVQFLKQHPGTYSHFILLDHQDWMADAKPKKLAEEWQYILDNAATGTRILFRSASPSASFLPSFVKERLFFNDDLTSALHPQDRVGTYESTHLGIVQ
jgi:S-adenosylmethionine-diacylglycerol 3-amino-3-carboxypropyl transferase